jgi:NADH-quinone oxidoreductase subunit M
MGAVAVFFAMASLGLPGLGNFVGEFLILTGVFKVSVLLTVFAAAGLIASAIYALWFVQKCFHGPAATKKQISDLSLRHVLIFAVMMILLIWLGLFPQPVLDTSEPAVTSIKNAIFVSNPEKSDPDIGEKIDGMSEEVGSAAN